MALIDKLRDLHAQPADGDLLAYLGVRPDRLKITRDVLVVGDEALPMTEARAAMAGPPVPQTPGPRRTVTIEDL